LTRKYPGKKKGRIHAVKPQYVLNLKNKRGGRKKRGKSASRGRRGREAQVNLHDIPMKAWLNREIGREEKKSLSNSSRRPTRKGEEFPSEKKVVGGKKDYEK